jgi:diguanylate cyclase (GGDEF)-like protein
MIELSMHEAVSKTTAGRLGAVLYLVSGVVTVISLVLPAPATLNALAVACVGILAMALAPIIWHLPWHRWPRRASLVLPLVALPLISVHNVAGGSDPYRWGLFYVVVSAWVGLAQPRGTFYLISPLLAISYALPLVVFNHPLWALSSSLYAVPVCGLVAESVAWAISRASQAQQALRESETRLRDLAHHDALTGLSNRTDFLLHLDEALSQRPVQGSVALMFADIDDFKGINDRLGHATGDEVLRHAAHSLNSGVRPGDLVARMGGDEFTVLLPRVGSLAEAVSIADRIREQLRKPVVCGDVEVAINASVGVALAAADDSAESLLHRADKAMYSAKRSGKDRAVVLDLAAA